MDIKKTAEVEIKYNTTVGELKALLEQIPTIATINITQQQGDARDPGYTRINFSRTD